MLTVMVQETSHAQDKNCDLLENMSGDFSREVGWVRRTVG